MIKFIPNREKYFGEFMIPKHGTFRKWYFKPFFKEQLDKF